jgi:cytochrome P450
VAAIMQKESIFGDDIAEFRPERFLECDKAKRHEMDQAIDTAFGGGRWMCAGRNVAVMEMNKLIFEVRRPPILSSAYIAGENGTDSEQTPARPQLRV